MFFLFLVFCHFTAMCVDEVLFLFALVRAWSELLKRSCLSTNLEISQRLSNEIFISSYSFSALFMKFLKHIVSESVLYVS